MPASGEKNITINGKDFVATTVTHGGATTTFDTDSSAVSADVICPSSNRPTVALGAGANGLKTVTLTGGDAGDVIVITQHGGSVSTHTPS